MNPLLDVIVVSTPPEPEATWSGAWQLLLAIPVGFLVLLGVVWLGTAVASYVKRHAAKVKSNLSASSEVPQSRPPEAPK